MITNFLKFNENIQDDDHDIDTIVDSYLEAVLFTVEDNDYVSDGDTDDDDEDDDDVIYPFKGKTIYDFSDAARQQAYEDIAWFIDNAGNYIDDISDEALGYDIWLTRDGQGAGFRDRGYDYDIEKKLVELAGKLSQIEVYIDDDDKIKFSSSKNSYIGLDVELWKKNHKVENLANIYDM